MCEVPAASIACAEVLELRRHAIATTILVVVQDILFQILGSVAGAFSRREM